MRYPITEHVLKTDRHTSFYLACGPEDAPLMIFAHGWPELSISWRNQLPVFGNMGFRAIAPDMRGYGRSSVYPKSSDYAVENITNDMIELIDGLGREKAIWVGHDWGSPIIWSVAQHHPKRCHAVANLCVPYIPGGFAPANVIPLADRTVYPEENYPAAQWDYQLNYIANLEATSRAFDAADTLRFVKLMFRSGNPAGKGQPAGAPRKKDAPHAKMDLTALPDMPRDANVITEEEAHQYAAALKRNGFYGPDSWYVNPDANVAFAAKAKATWRLEMPVLFVHAAYDYVCETLVSDLPKPMREYCPRLTEAHVESGHWMAQEKPLAVNAALARWMAKELPELWVAK
jgi:pimeloyl-ACP methyl ester carboxylesterase